MLAYEFGHIVIVKLLLEQKGIINIVDNNGKKFTNELDSKDEINTLPKIRDENNQRDNFIPGHCTFEQAGYKFVQHNRLYTCKTCMKNSRNNLCFCEECAKVCHKGHDVRVKSTRQQGFCDCGAGYFLHPCKLNPKHHEVNEE